MDWPTRTRKYVIAALLALALALLAWMGGTAVGPTDDGLCRWNAALGVCEEDPNKKCDTGDHVWACMEKRAGGCGCYRR